MGGISLYLTIGVKESPFQNPSIFVKLLDTTPEYLTGESDDPGHAPEPPEKQKKLLAEASSLSDAELEKALEYIQFLKSQRKK